MGSAGYGHHFGLTSTPQVSQTFGGDGRYVGALRASVLVICVSSGLICETEPLPWLLITVVEDRRLDTAEEEMGTADILVDWLTSVAFRTVPVNARSACLKCWT